MSVLKGKNLSKTFFSPARLDVLKEVSLELSHGESLAIMGKSGEGKSTLLHILGTLEKPTSGTVEICGKEASASHAAGLRSRHLGFIFQSFHLLEECTTLENILMPAKIARHDTGKHSAAYKRALMLLERVGLLSHAQVLAKFLSGGEKQRVAIARALCNDPDLILADEPSGNLDRVTSKVIHDLLISTTKEHGKALIVVTHDLELAHLCDNRLMLKEGVLNL